eukprot:TRINITY_DN28222_c0_g1_i1.p1 TRINITY_DN28222_c0_g1~~TRINITY_DN28222_c0_g1_i1.p1  ORF type:complete len:108 (+),score=9.40 TRINITY_DN28222_c0_g1_i1:44-325(+)
MEIKRLKSILLCHKDAITRLHIRGPFSISPVPSHGTPPAPWHPPPCKGPSVIRDKDASRHRDRSSDHGSAGSSSEAEAFWARRISNFLQPALP